MAETFQKRPIRIRPRSIGIYISFFIFSVIVLIPIYWMFRSGFARMADVIKIPPVYFPPVTLENFATLINQIPFAQYFTNSIMFSIGSTLLTLLVSFMAAYAFARIKFPGSGIILWVLLISMALPEVSTVIPLYRILSGLGMLDTLRGLILVMSSVLTPFTVWVLISFIKQVPYEIEEAAIIDGASLPQIFVKILLPVTMPGLVTMGLINFINAWNNLLYPLSFSISPESKTLSVAITEVFVGHSPYGKPWVLIMALGVVMTIPSVILVVLSQRAIVRGLTGGAVK